MILTKRDFHGPDFTRYMQQEYEKIRQRRKAFKGKPDEYDRIQIALDRDAESFYKSQLD